MPTPSKQSTRTNLSRAQGGGVPQSGGSSSPMRSSRNSSASMTSVSRVSSSGGRPSGKSNSSSTRKNGPSPYERRSLNETAPDDISEVSEGDPVDFEEEDEPQFKYSTADLADGSPRNTTCCLVAMCVICVILAIVISVVMVKYMDKKDESNAPAPSAPTAAPGSNGSVAGQGAFPSSLDQVNLDCNGSNDATCATTCSGFDCCDPIINDQAGCFHGNRQGCLDYARCHTLSSSLEAPGDTLAILCSKSRVASDPSACEAACQAAKCCWDDNSSCVANGFYGCVDYLVCQNLRGAEMAVPPPPDSLRVVCDANQASSMSQADSCDVACAPASCCWESGSLNNCLQDNFFTCLAYEPCGQLSFAEAFSVVPNPEVDTGLICSETYVAMNGPAECEAKCNLGSCCNTGPGASCFDQDPLGCLQYDGCKLLQL